MSEYAIGKSTATSNQHAMSSDVATPGKSTLTQQNTWDTDPVHGGGWESGERAKTKGLGPTARRQMELFFGLRAVRAEGHLNNAVERIKAEVAAEAKEKAQEPGLIASIVLGMISANLALAGKLAMKKLMTPGAIKSLTEVAGVTEKVEENELRAGQIEGLVGSTVDYAKDKTKPVAANVEQGDGDERSSRADAFLTEVSESAGTYYQNTTERIIRQGTDAELLTACEAMDTEYNTTEIFERGIKAQLRRFMASHASHIGREGKRGETENRVAWLLHRDGEKQLIYVSKTFDAQKLGDVAHRPAYQAPGALSLADETSPDENTGFIKGDDEQQHDVNAGFVGFVEPDLVDTALKFHRATWQEEPKTYDWTVVMGGSK